MLFSVHVNACWPIVRLLLKGVQDCCGTWRYLEKICLEHPWKNTNICGNTEDCTKTLSCQSKVEFVHFNYFCPFVQPRNPVEALSSGLDQPPMYDVCAPAKLPVTSLSWVLDKRMSNSTLNFLYKHPFLFLSSKSRTVNALINMFF